MQVIGIYGVNAVGKSTLAHLLSQDYTEYDTVATDNLLAIKRMLNSTEPVWQQSSYTQWQRLGDPSAENIWKGFVEYREGMQDYMRCILRRARDQKVGMIIEGVHINPEVFLEYQNELDIKLFILTITNKDIHKARINQKCDYRPELLKRLEINFQYIRDLQERCKEEAEKFPVHQIETGYPITNALNKMREKIV